MSHCEGMRYAGMIRPRRLAALAVLTVRQAVRSGSLAALLTLLLGGIVLLLTGVTERLAPGDRLQVVVRYALALCTWVPGIGLLWMACGAVAREAAGRTLSPLRVQPVTTLEIWLGKWMGLGVLSAVLLGAAWMTVAAGAFCLGGGPPAAVAAGLQPTGPAGAVVAAPGVPVEWIVSAVPRRVTAAPQLEYAFLSPWRDQPAVRAMWTVRDARGRVRVQAGQRAFLDGLNRLAVPAGLAGAPLPWRVRFAWEPLGEPPEGRLVFHPEHPPVLRRPVAGFGTNLAPGLFLVWLRLNLLTALGLTVGAMFSFPVALFTAGGTVAAALFVHAFVIGAGGAGGPAMLEGALPPGWAERAGGELARRLAAVVEPVMRGGLRARPALGEYVSWRELGRTAWLLTGVYGALAGALGALVLSRREAAVGEAEDQA